MGLELLFLLLPVAALSGWLIGRRGAPKEREKCPDFSAEYYRGLNYLLNEQPDKAIEVFVQMLEVDSDTVETHFALGNLFRRRGEVDRAIRIHQNLIARPTLTQHQREQALFELGLDYMRAGLLDRAEALFSELVGDSTYMKPALRQLLDIYQQEREWTRAVEVANRLEAIGKGDLRPIVAHFYCEMAEAALKEEDVGQALKWLKQALSEDRNCARASLFEGELYVETGSYKAAVKALRRIEQQDPGYMVEALGPLRHAYCKLGRNDELKVFLARLAEAGDGSTPAIMLSELIRDEEGREPAIEFLTGYLQQHPSARGVARLIELQSVNGVAESCHLELLGQITNGLLEGKPGYQCHNCGFTAKALHWQCPGCKGWGTVKPIHGLDGE